MGEHTNLLDCEAGRAMGCRSFCCRLIVRLKKGEALPGHEPGKKFCVDKSPSDGLCVYFDRESGRCEIWDERPTICREYDCNYDPLLQVVLRDGFHSLLQLVSAPRPDTEHRVPYREREPEDDA